MKQLLSVFLMVLLAILTVGCASVAFSGNYRLESGETVPGDLVIASGQATLEQNSRVTGTVYVTSGNADIDGEIDGNLVVTSGNVNLGPHSIIRGTINRASGSITRAEGARVEGGSVSAETTGFSLGTIGSFITWFTLLCGSLLALVLFLGRGTRNQQLAPSIDTPTDTRTSGNASLLLGPILIMLGLLFLVSQIFPSQIWRISWPIFIILPGLLFFAGMILGGRNAGWLAIPGSMITITGLIFLYQNTFNQFQSWAYAWALIFPTSIGVGQYIHGLWGNNPDTRQNGTRLMNAGLVIFFLGAVFFELLLNISGFVSNAFVRLLFPLVLIGLGAYLLLFRRLVPARK